MSTALGWNLITLPAYPPAPSSIEYIPTDQLGITRSTFTNGEQVFDWLMGYWSWNIIMPNMTETTAEPWIGIMLALQGVGNVFQIGDPRRQSPQGVIGGSPVVDGSGQTGFSIQVSGFTSGSVVTPGDYLQIGFRLYRCTAQATSSGGIATISIWPNLRESPINGTPVIFTNTQGLFRLKNNTRPWRVGVNRFYTLTIEAVEVINPAP